MKLKRAVAALLAATISSSIVVPEASARIYYNHDQISSYRHAPGDHWAAARFEDSVTGEIVDPWWNSCKWVEYEMHWWGSRLADVRYYLDRAEKPVTEHADYSNRVPLLHTNMAGLLFWNGQWSRDSFTNALNERINTGVYGYGNDYRTEGKYDDHIFNYPDKIVDLNWTVGNLNDKDFSWPETAGRHASKMVRLYREAINSNNDLVQLHCEYPKEASQGYDWSKVPKDISMQERTRYADELQAGTADLTKVTKVPRLTTRVKVSELQVPAEYANYKPSTVSLQGSTILDGNKGGNLKVGVDTLHRTWGDKLTFGSIPAWADHLEFVGTSNPRELALSINDTKNPEKAVKVKAVPAWSGVNITLTDAETGTPVVGVEPRVDTLSTLGLDQTVALKLPTTDLRGNSAKKQVMPGVYKWSVPGSDKYEAYTEQTSFGAKNKTGTYQVKLTPVKGKISLSGMKPGTYTFRSKDFGTLSPVEVTVGKDGKATTGPLHWGTWEMISPDGTTREILVSGNQTTTLGSDGSTSTTDDGTGAGSGETHPEGPVTINVGVPGVRVALVGPDGTVVAEGVTDPDGKITFPDLPIGDYTVVPVDDDGNIITVDAPFSPIHFKVTKDTTSNKSTKKSTDAVSALSSGKWSWLIAALSVLALVGGGLSMWWAHLTPEQRLAFLPPVY